MASEGNASVSNPFTEFQNAILPFSARVSLLLVVLIPSILCSLIALSTFLTDKALRNAMHNHVIIILLIGSLFCELTIFPWSIHFYRSRTIWLTNPFFCQLATFIEYEYYMMQLMIFAWATIERHILIFHDRWLITLRRRLIFHYLPIVGIMLYSFGYYGLVIFFPFCEPLFDYNRFRCVYLCAYANDVLYVWDTVVNQLLPNLIIIFASVGLLVRVVWQKRRLHQSMQWRKYRKMTTQIISIAIVYFVFSVPWSFLNFLSTCGVPFEKIAVISSYASFGANYVFLLFPFVCLTSLPNTRDRLRYLLRYGRRHPTIVPAPLNNRT